MQSPYDFRPCDPCADLNRRIELARGTKDAATSSLYADMEAEAREWRRLKRAFAIAAVIIVSLSLVVVFA